MRGHQKRGQRETLGPGGNPGSQTRNKLASDEKSFSSRKREVREIPEPSNVWQNCGFAFLTAVAGTIIAALTVSNGAPVDSLELWMASGALAGFSSLCFLAHWDVNRGRKTWTVIVEEGSAGG